MRSPYRESVRTMAKLVSVLALTALLLACAAQAEPEWTYGADSPEEFRQLRADRRAYDGAPPVVPHEIAALGREECLNCHQAGSVENADRIAPPRSHPAWGDCRQCHIEQAVDSVFQATSFEPLRWPSQGSRLYASAPPTIPHTRQNRQDCEVCHVGAQAHPVLRTSHEYRQNCNQCHVASVP
jgi:cytochrome c-type protein NapB